MRGRMDMLSKLVTPEQVRQFLRVALFAALIVLFRHLLILFVFFVAFERLFGAGADFLAKRRVNRKLSIAGMALGTLGIVVGAAALQLGRVMREWVVIRENLSARLVRIREMPLYQEIEDRLQDQDKLAEWVQHHAGDALHYFGVVGHLLLYALIGFIIAVVYLLEREEIDHWAAGLDARSLFGTFARWLGHVADAISVTLQFQVIVAAVNAALTSWVLVVIGVPHKIALLFMIFVSGLVPVVGNFIAGVVISILAYQAKGWIGAAAFVVLTFILHKIESYYLNPRLAKRHVRLPGFVLIVSLILWEHLLGFVGLFVSFPFLFIAIRIKNELTGETPVPAAAAAPAPVQDGVQSAP